MKLFFSHSSPQVKLRLLLPLEVQKHLYRHLRRGGICETGGILMGEHVGPNEFRVLEITGQKQGGSYARFVRTIGVMMRPLQRFFRNRKHDYARYNYIGEWHSHPSFALIPSFTDCETMQAIVEDNAVGATFVALLILKLDVGNSLAAEVVLFQPGVRPIAGEVVFEG